MKKFIKELFSNPDNTASTKRTAGWIMLFSTLALGFYGVWSSTEAGVFDVVFLTFTTSFMGLFGISSIDYNTYVKSLSIKGNEKLDNTNNTAQGPS